MTSTMMRDAAISFPMLGDLTMNPPASFTFLGREIYWYGVLLALAFLAVLVWVVTHAKNFGIAKDDVYDEAIGCIIFGVLGCRIYYVIFQWDYYSQHLNEIIRVWDGGIAMYGGIIAAVLFLVFFTRKRKISLGAILDADASGMLLGHCIGRWGNFINREAFGVETDAFCRMGLTRPGQETVYVHPTFLYESLWTITGFFLLNLYLRKKGRRYDGQAFLMYICWYGLGRAMIEGLRTDSLFLIPGVIRASQALGLATFLVTGAILLIQARRPHDPSRLYLNRIQYELTDPEPGRDDAGEDPQP
jgi:phosphatidylglycerol:prolipoprotein diacylglycerol transferase